MTRRTACIVVLLALVMTVLACRETVPESKIPEATPTRGETQATTLPATPTPLTWQQGTRGPEGETQATAPPATATPTIQQESTPTHEGETQATAAPAATPTTGFPRPPSTARIAFWATGWTVPGASQEIFVMNTDGTGITAISNTRGDDMYPSWSPDGKRIAFVSRRDGNLELYVMNADGSGQTRLTNSPEGEFHPRWSPDGTKIIFSRLIKPGLHDLYVISVDGSNIYRLTDTPDVMEEYPDWSPDGKQIVFSRFGGGAAGIYVMDADGSNVRLLMAGPLHFPKWSPDGKYIAFDGEPAGCKFEIYIMKADGSDMRQVTEHPIGCGGYNKHPSWSPDGKQLVYYSTDRFGPGGFDIFVIHVDGSGETALTHGVTDLNAGGRDPDWSRVP